MQFKIEESGEYISIFLRKPGENEDLIGNYFKQFGVDCTNKDFFGAVIIDQISFDWWSDYFLNEQLLLDDVAKLLSNFKLDYASFTGEMVVNDDGYSDPDFTQIYQREVVNAYLNDLEQFNNG